MTASAACTLEIKSSVPAMISTGATTASHWGAGASLISSQLLTYPSADDSWTAARTSARASGCGEGARFLAAVLAAMVKGPTVRAWLERKAQAAVASGVLGRGRLGQERMRWEGREGWVAAKWRATWGGKRVSAVSCDHYSL